jgi:uncharacterized protein (DUF427 family)
VAGVDEELRDELAGMYAADQASRQVSADWSLHGRPRRVVLDGHDRRRVPEPRSPGRASDEELEAPEAAPAGPLAGETRAESARPMAVFETGEPTRFYCAQADVRRNLLEPSETVTTSPYIGSAVWFSARIGGELHPDVAWTYRFTIPQLPRIAGLIAFRDDLVREL